jgi:hypothetical protein
MQLSGAKKTKENLFRTKTTRNGRLHKIRNTTAAQLPFESFRLNIVEELLNGPSNQFAPIRPEIAGGLFDTIEKLGREFDKQALVASLRCVRPPRWLVFRVCLKDIASLFHRLKSCPRLWL